MPWWGMGVAVGALGALGLCAWRTQTRLAGRGEAVQNALERGGSAAELALALGGAVLREELELYGREETQRVAERHMRNVYGVTPALVAEIAAVRRQWRL